MPSTYTCVRGHQWDTGTPQCPVCGESVARSLETTGADHSAPPASACLPPLTIPGYEVLIELGRGGMGVVHQARHHATGRLVALKVLRDALLDSPQQRSRFRTEAEALTRLRHANVVGLIEAGERDGRPYFVMELVTGGSLDRRLAGQPQPAGEAAALVETLARAVAFAHEQGIVHRDLKPSNILIAEDGTPKLNDFGVARQLDNDTRQTKTGAVLGTPRYMSPEQAEGRIDRIGPAADVWALGVILYEMLTGRTPFIGAGMIEVLDQVRNAEPVPPSKLQPGVPRDLETICLKCLHKDPAGRYGDAGALAEDLRRFREDRPITARRVGLRERAVKWRRRHPVLATLMTTAVLLSLAGMALGVWYWDAYRREKVEYYAAYTSRFGVKEGVARLSAKEVARRNLNYKFCRQGGRVVRMEVVDSRGELTPGAEIVIPLARGVESYPQSHKSRECRFEYLWNQQGELVEETARDRNGNVLWSLHYTTPTTAHYKTLKRTAEGGAHAGMVPGLPQSRTRSGATYLQFTWTGEGHEALVRYLDREGKPRPDDGHAYGKRQEHDARGLVVRQTWLDEKGRPTRHTRTRVATLALAYDAQGQLIEETCLDEHGRPCLHHDGYHQLRARFDERGNLIEKSCHGLNGEPLAHRMGYYKATLRWSENGTAVEGAYFGADGRPCLHVDGNHRYTARCDEAGNKIEEAYFDVDDRPCLCKDGFHRGAARHDKDGNPVELAYFGVDGQPCLCREGNHRFLARFDERGNKVEETYFGVDGKRCRVKEGYSKVTARYDERGNLIERAYWGPDERPCLHTDGFHRVRAGYDEQGNQIEEALFDRSGRPCKHKLGFHKVKGRCDQHGNRVEGAFFGVDGKPCLHTDGNHRFVARFDERGNKVEESYFGVDDKPCRHRDGNHKVTARHDERGNLIEVAFFGLDGQPCLVSAGFHKLTALYDGRDKRTEVTLYDTRDRKQTRRSLDEKGQAVRTTVFLYPGRQALDRLGAAVACLARTTDARGRLSEEAYHGSDGRPVRNKQGYARYTVTHDARGQVASRAYFDVNGKPMATRVVIQIVLPGSQGQRLNLAVGDVLLRYDGRPVTQMAEILHSRQAEASTEPARPLVILRKGETRTVQVAPGPLGVVLADVADGQTK